MIAEVIDIEDPKKEGRVKLRIMGQNDQKDSDGNYKIPSDALPWARNGNGHSGGSSSGSGEFSLPKVGSIVRCEGSVYNLIYYESVHISKELLKDIADSYQTSHVIIHDTDLGGGDGSREGEYIKVYFTDNQGFIIDYKTPNGNNKIHLGCDDNISIENAYGVKISIEGKDVTMSGIGTLDIQAEDIKLGKGASKRLLTADEFRTVFNTHTHPTNYGYTLAPTPMKGEGISNHVTAAL